MRSRFADGFDGVPAPVVGAGYAAGRQLSGSTGNAVPDADEVVFASAVFLDDLAAHAELTSGAWPAPGRPTGADRTGRSGGEDPRTPVGDRVPVTDRVTGGHPGDRGRVLAAPEPRDAYWRLVPDVAKGVTSGSATYGPLVVDRADFLSSFVANVPRAWLVEPV